MEKKGNEAAFSLKKVDGDGYNLGLTKREYFAGLAMQGLLASCTGEDFPSEYSIASQAIRKADALLRALAESEAQNA